MDSKAVSRWCDARREMHSAGGPGQCIEIEDPYRLRNTERDAIASQCARFNLALYRFARCETDPDALSAFANEMGLGRRDLTLGADHRGIASVQVAPSTHGPEMIPFTSRALNWHTDGYYNAPGQSVRGVVMHCAVPALNGGETTLLDPDLVYATMHDQDPALVQALAHPGAMTIPAHEADGALVRPRPHRTRLPISRGFLRACSCDTRCARVRSGGVPPRTPPAPSPRSKRPSPRSPRIMCKRDSGREKASSATTCCIAARRSSTARTRAGRCSGSGRSIRSRMDSAASLVVSRETFGTKSRLRACPCGRSPCFAIACLI